MAYLTGAQRYDVLFVGDVATDVIIRLPEGGVRLRNEGGERFLELPLGEKLAIARDVTVAAGGSAANAAVALARLDCRVGIATFLAHDQVGFDLLNALHVESVDTHLIHIDFPARTNRDFVLSFGGERTILVRDEAFNYHWPHLRPSEVPAWLCIASLGGEALDYQDQIADWLDGNPSVRVAFQPGTFQIAAGMERLERLYRRAEYVFFELAGARTLLETPDADAPELASGLAAMGCRCVVVSDDHGGGTAATSSGGFTVARFPDSTPRFDVTGAGDAFAAGVLAAIVHGKEIGEALRWGAADAMSVAHELGSQLGLLHSTELAGYLEDAGEDYVAVAIAPEHATSDSAGVGGDVRP